MAVDSKWKTKHSSLTPEPPPGVLGPPPNEKAYLKGVQDQIQKGADCGLWEVAGRISLNMNGSWAERADSVRYRGVHITEGPT